MGARAARRTRHAWSSPALLSGGYQAQSADAVLLRIPIARHNNIARHSLRAGRATAAARCASERAAMAQTGHRSADVVGRYVGEANLSNENAASLVDLCILVHAERRPRSIGRSCVLDVTSFARESGVRM